jgi:hypothetical protein
MSFHMLLALPGSSESEASLQSRDTDGVGRKRTRSTLSDRMHLRPMSGIE